LGTWRWVVGCAWHPCCWWLQSGNLPPVRRNPEPSAPARIRQEDMPSWAHYEQSDASGYSCVRSGNLASHLLSRGIEVKPTTVLDLLRGEHGWDGCAGGVYRVAGPRHPCCRRLQGRRLPVLGRHQTSCPLKESGGASPTLRDAGAGDRSSGRRCAEHTLPLPPSPVPSPTSLVPNRNRCPYSFGHNDLGRVLQININFMLT